MAEIIRSIIPNFRRDEVTNEIVTINRIDHITISPLYSMVVLEEFPDNNIRIEVQFDDEEQDYLIEVFNKDDVISNTYFFVSGRNVYFYKDMKNQKVILSYSGIGDEKIDSSIISTKTDNTGSVTETLNQIIETGRIFLDGNTSGKNALEIITELDEKIVIATELSSNINIVNPSEVTTWFTTL